MVLASLAGPALAQDAPLPPAPDPTPAETAVPPSPPPVPAADVAVLQTRLDALEQRTKTLEAERARLLSQPPAAPRTAAAFTADESGFSLTSADRLYQFRLKGQFQVDGRRFFGDANLAQSDTFLVRRARPIIAGTLFGLTDFYLAPDFGNNAAATLYDAYLDTHPWPWLRLRVGKFKGPVGLERLQSDSDLVFVERALDQNLSSQREIGAQLWGDIGGGLVHWDVGIFNGNPDNGLNDIDTNHGKTYAGRIFIQPFALPALRVAGRLGVGIAASRGDEKGTAANPWLNAFKSPSQQSIFTYLATPTANAIFAQGRHTRINPQLYYYIGPFGLLAEWVKEYQELANSAGTGAVNNNAAHATVSFVIGGDETYEGPKPHHPASIAGHTFGALEIGLRYEYLNIDTAAFPTAADPSKSVRKAQSGGIALNWQLTRNIKASADFVESWFEGGASKGNRANEKIGLARFQVYF